MLVLNTSSPKTVRRAPKKAPRTAVPSSRTREPSIPLDPDPIFDAPYEGLPPEAIGVSRTRGPREVEVVQPLDHLVPMAPLPVHATTGWALPKLLMTGAHALRHAGPNRVGRDGDQRFVADRASR